jgi:hypothetical protein
VLGARLEAGEISPAEYHDKVKTLESWMKSEKKKKGKKKKEKTTGDTES